MEGEIMEIPVVVWVLLVIFILSWILLPFAIWGVLGRLKRIYTEQQHTNDLLNENVKYMKQLSDEAEKTLAD
ncbi:MAG: hypothetical protein U5P41_12780 [Gammaproteobacteria bacterium]|nr:hypothetical protein [Gammaproteobacteria bacterium]